MSGSSVISSLMILSMQWLHMWQTKRVGNHVPCDHFHRWGRDQVQSDGSAIPPPWCPSCAHLLASLPSGLTACLACTAGRCLRYLPPPVLKPMNSPHISTKQALQPSWYLQVTIQPLEDRIEYCDCWLQNPKCTGSWQLLVEKAKVVSSKGQVTDCIEIHCIHHPPCWRTLPSKLIVWGENYLSRWRSGPHYDLPTKKFCKLLNDGRQKTNLWHPASFTQTNLCIPKPARIMRSRWGMKLNEGLTAQPSGFRSNISTGTAVSKSV